MPKRTIDIYRRARRNPKVIEILNGLLDAETAISMYQSAGGAEAIQAYFPQLRQMYRAGYPGLADTFCTEEAMCGYFENCETWSGLLDAIRARGDEVCFK